MLSHQHKLGVFDLLSDSLCSHSPRCVQRTRLIFTRTNLRTEPRDRPTCEPTVRRNVFADFATIRMKPVSHRKSQACVCKRTKIPLQTQKLATLRAWKLTQISEFPRGIKNMQTYGISAHRKTPPTLAHERKASLRERGIKSRCEHVLQRFSHSNMKKDNSRFERV